MTHSNLDAPSSEELFRLTDNGSGGLLQTAKRRLKFRLRYWLCEVQLHRIRSFFQAHGLAELTHSELPVMLRPMRPYLWGGLNPQARTNAMLAHFEWLMARHSAQTVVDFYKRGSFTYFTGTSTTDATQKVKVKDIELAAFWRLAAGPLYAYARAGIEIEREPRRVTIHQIDIVNSQHHLLLGECELNIGVDLIGLQKLKVVKPHQRFVPAFLQDNTVKHCNAQKL